jgi:hypothetical protein
MLVAGETNDKAIFETRLASCGGRTLHAWAHCSAQTLGTHFADWEGEVMTVAGSCRPLKRDRQIKTSVPAKTNLTIDHPDD